MIEAPRFQPRRVSVYLIAAGAFASALTALSSAAFADVADDLKLSLAVAEGEAALADAFTLTVSLKNHSAELSYPVKAMEWDFNSVYFRVTPLDVGANRKGRGKTFILNRFHMTPNPQLRRVEHQVIAETTLAPGQTLSLEWRFPALRPGRCEVSARYRGLPLESELFPETLASNTLTLTTTPRQGKGDLRASFTTSQGGFVTEFYPESAWAHVDNFVRLAQAGKYDGLTFHRIKPDQFIQGGCSNGDGSGSPGWSIPLETDHALKHTPGMLSAARSGWSPHTAGQQFFVMAGAQPGFDPHPNVPGGEGYSIFGRVVSGLDVVRAISRLPTITPPGQTENSRPQNLVRLDSVKILVQ